MFILSGTYRKIRLAAEVCVLREALNEIKGHHPGVTKVNQSLNT